MAKKTIKKVKQKDNSGLILVACLFVGLGIGTMTHNTAAWTLLGLGAGFLGMFIMRQKMK